MADRSLYIEIVLDDKGAVAKLNQLDGALRKAGSGAQAGEKDLSKFESAMTRASAVGTFLGTALYNLVSRGLTFLVDEMGRAITLSSQATAAFMGLSSVAAAFGADITMAKDAAKSLSADGLMKVSEAALGLKNLLASGFSLPQATRLMVAFKDSAAFGRQASLDFGYAVVSATEGIKNQNSILVDNAGVTKNLSVILKEAGFAATDLASVSTNAKVRMALFNGILKETAAQTGDAARLTGTYSGAMSKLKTQYEFTLATIGAAITENKSVATVLTFVSDQIMGVNTNLTDMGRAFTIVSDIVLGVVKGFQFLLTVIDYVQKAFFYVKASAFAVVQAFVNLKGTIDLVLLGILETIQKVPGASTVLGKLDATVTELRESVTRGKGQFDQLTTEIVSNMDAADANSAAIGNFHHALGTLVSNLEKSRGETVQLGGAQQKLRAATVDTTAALEAQVKATKALQEARANFLAKSAASAGFAFGMSGSVMGPDGSWINGGSIAINRQKLFDPIYAGNANDEANDAAGVTQSWYQARQRQMLDEQDSALAASGRVGAGTAGFNMNSFLKDNLGDTILKALTGGGSLTSSIGGLFGQGVGSKLSTQFGASIGGMFGEGGIGKMLGSTLGSMLPGIGALAGPLIGKLGGMLGGLFGGGEGAKTNDERDTFMSQFGGTKGEAEAELTRLATQAGVTEAELKKLYSTDKVEDFKKRAAEVTAQIEAQQKVLEKYGVTWKDFKGAEQTRRLGDEVKKLTGDYDALIRAGLDHETAVKKVGPAYLDLAISAVQAGQAIPAALAPVVLQMAQLGQLTEAQAAALLGMATDSGPSFKQMEDAANKYGIALDDLGARYHQLKVNDTAEALAADFKLLTEGGAPVREVLAGMADEVNRMVQEAIKYGAQIPASMRPVLAQMIEQGQLVDANGAKLTDLSQIDFASAIQSSTEKLIDKMTQLIASIQGIAANLSAIPDHVDTEVRIRRRYVDSDGGEGTHSYHQGGFVRRAHTGLAIDEVPIIAQTGEGVINRDGMRRIGRSGLHSLNHGGAGGGDVAGALLRLAAAIESRPVEVSIDGEVLAAAHTKAIRRRVGPARKF